jgi:hypothetical protein
MSTTHSERYHTEGRRWDKTVKLWKETAREVSLLVNLHKVERLRKKKIKHITANPEVL